MRNALEYSWQAASRLGHYWAAAFLCLSLLVHFSADLAWLYRQAMPPDAAQAAAVQPAGSSDRAFSADPDGGTGAFLTQAWSVPAWYSLAVTVILAPRDRALPRLPLLHPPSSH